MSQFFKGGGLAKDNLIKLEDILGYMDRNSAKSLLKYTGILGLASFGVGAVHGFIKARGVELHPSQSEILTYAPVIIQGSIGAIVGGFAGLADSSDQLLNNKVDPNLENIAMMVLAPVGLSIFAGATTALLAGLEVTLGYYAGYALGYASEFVF